MVVRGGVWESGDVDKEDRRMRQRKPSSDLCERTKSRFSLYPVRYLLAMMDLAILQWVL